MKINKKIVSHFLGLAVLFGAVEVTHQLTKTEKQTTYSVTLESLVLGNGETNGENGGSVGGGADGENGGTPTPRGYSRVTISEVTQMEIRDVSECTEETRSREATTTVCGGRGTILCTPSVVPTTRWSAWSLRTKDEDGCQ